MTLGNLISAARFTGFLFHGDVNTQHLSAGLFSNVRFVDFITGLPKDVVALGLLGLCFITAPTQTPPSSQDVDVIRTETDLTNVLFTATDKNKRYLTTLQQGGEVRKERAHCFGIQFARMAFAVKKDESLDPVAIGCFGADTEMPEASDVGDLIEQLFLDHN